MVTQRWLLSVLVAVAAASARPAEDAPEGPEPVSRAARAPFGSLNGVEAVMDPNVQEMGSQHAESAEKGERYAGGYPEATTFPTPTEEGENLVADHRSGRQLPADRTGHNPILSYLLQRADSNSTGSPGGYRGGVRRRITHQETIIDPRLPFPTAVPSAPQEQTVGGPQSSGVPGAGQSSFGTQMAPQQSYPAIGSPVPTTGNPNGVSQGGQTYPAAGQPSGNVRIDGKVPDVNVYTTMNFYPSIVAGQPYPYVSAADSNRLESGMVQGRISWPFADYFPIVIKDPVNHFYNAFTTMIEYGPDASSDTCGDFGDERDEGTKDSKGRRLGRTGRADVASFSVGRANSGEKSVAVTTVPYGPVVARLLVQKGGVAIAGPGGSADSGVGGTSVVGPGGIVYARPNGLAVLGPGARVISLPLGSSQLRSARDPLPAGARVLAVGPTVYFHSATL